MKQLFNINGEIYKFLDGMYQLMLLNGLIIITSIPMVTIPCALITAYQLLKEKNKQIITSKRYFNLFKQNIRLSLKIILVFCVGFPLLVLLLSLFLGTILQFLILLIIAFFLVYFSNMLLMCESQIEMSHLLKKSLAITLKYAGYNSIGLSFLIVSFFIPIFLPKLGFLWVLFGLSLPMLLQVTIYKQVIVRLAIK